MRNMSALGIAAYSNAALTPSSKIELIVLVPYEISLTLHIRVRLQAEALRVDNSSTPSCFAATLLPPPAVNAEELAINTLSRR